MSKEYYKGYLIESWSHTSENRSWDGHTSSGDGTYSTSYGTDIINKRTLKVIKSCDCVEDAKRYVDNHLVGEGLKANKKIHSQIAKMEKRIKAEEKKLESLIKQLKFLKRKAPANPSGA